MNSPTKLPRKPPDGERMVTEVRQQMRHQDYTQRRQPSNDGVRYKRRERGGLNGERRRKAEQHTGTHQYPLRRHFSFMKVLVNGRAHFWYNCGQRRLDLETFSSKGKCRTFLAPAASVEKEGRLLFIFSYDATCSRTSEIGFLEPSPEETTSGLS